MTDYWYDMLKAMPFTSKKSGKMLNLLKASAKPINKNKKRKVVPLLGKIGDFHKANQVMASQSKQKPQNDIFNFKAGNADEADDNNSEMSKQ